jgi:type 1 glutamine amidotransferase
VEVLVIIAIIAVLLTLMPSAIQTARENARRAQCNNNLRSIAWVHEYGKARVFGCQSGHDAKVWTNDSFRRLMAQGIRWASGRLPDAEKK